MSHREVGRLVEEQLMDCHTPDRARRIAAGPLVLPEELQQRDRRDLDDAVFELLGVSDPKERDELIGRLYEATAQSFSRDSRGRNREDAAAGEIQQPAFQRARSGGRHLGCRRT